MATLQLTHPDHLVQLAQLDTQTVVATPPVCVFLPVFSSLEEVDAPDEKQITEEDSLGATDDDELEEDDLEDDDFDDDDEFDDDDDDDDDFDDFEDEDLDEEEDEEAGEEESTGDE